MDFYLRTIKQQCQVAGFLVVGHPAMLMHPECKKSQHTHSASNKPLLPPASYANVYRHSTGEDTQSVPCLLSQALSYTQRLPIQFQHQDAGGAEITHVACRLGTAPTP